MTGRFDYFVILAGMRTGSNFLERNLNALPDIRCYGELFNPYFIAYEDQQSFLGLTLAEREADPMAMVTRIREDFDGLPGFRLFYDHDPRVRAAALAEPRCAKVVLTRPVLDSYISFRLARATDQWVLTDAKGRREAKAVFLADQFRRYQADQAAYLADIRRALQVTGQTAFELAYDDLGSLEVLDGLARFLGSAHRPESFDRSLKKQNPEGMREKVENFDEMRAALTAMDPFGLDFEPVFEAERGAAVPTWEASASAALLHQPVPGGPTVALRDWLGKGGPLQGFPSQKELRKWLRETPSHRAFAVLRHPVARAWHVFVTHVLPPEGGIAADQRQAIVERYKVPLPPAGPGPAMDAEALRAAFLAFLKFVHASLAGQTSFRIDPLWASQAALVQGFSGVRPPDAVIREGDDAAIAALLPGSDPVAWPAPVTAGDVSLAAVHDPAIEAAARKAYPRDYLLFGFGDWAP